MQNLPVEALQIADGDVMSLSQTGCLGLMMIRSRLRSGGLISLAAAATELRTGVDEKIVLNLSLLSSFRSKSRNPERTCKLTSSSMRRASVDSRCL